MLRDSRLYRFFVVVADELSFTAAAARLRVAQPWLSTRIRQLEADLGLELFNRTTRTVELTDAGRRLLPKARAVIAVAEDFELTARTLAGRSPTLRIGAPPYLAYVAEGRELMADFERAYPNVRVEMDVGWSEWLLGKLLSGDLDAAFLMGSESLDVLEEIPIAEVPLDIEFPDDDPLAAKREFTPADLAGRAVVMFTRSFNPHAFDQITRILLANGGDIHERKAMWSTGVRSRSGARGARRADGLGRGPPPLRPPAPPSRLHRAIAGENRAHARQDHSGHGRPHANGRRHRATAQGPEPMSA